MTDPHALLDAYAAKTYGEYSDRMDEIAPELFTALRAVVGIHKPHESGDVTCVECSTRADTYDDISWPCPTVQAITKALEG